MIGAPLSTETPVRIVVHGARGRMGARIAALALADPAFAIAALADQHDPADRAIVRAADVRGPADVVVDFSAPAGVPEALALAKRLGASLLVGTTGLPAALVDDLRTASADRAILLAPNTSLGVAVAAALLREAARLLPGFDASIFEAHHNAKKDAPSGTALRLARAIREAGLPIRDDQVVAIRGGDVVGEHTARFAGPGEYLEVTHRATSRDVFVHGALRAAAWLRGREAGWWTIEDVLGLPRA